MQNRDETGLLLEFSSGSLDADRTAWLARHIESCQECGRLVREQRLISEALESWEAAPVSADFDRRLYRRIEEEAVAGRWRRWFQPVLPMSFRPVMPLAALFLVLAATLLFQTPAPVSPEKQATVENIDADQLERTLDDIDMLQQLGVISLPEDQNSGEVL